MPTALAKWSQAAAERRRMPTAVAVRRVARKVGASNVDTIAALKEHVAIATNYP